MILATPRTSGSSHGFPCRFELSTRGRHTVARLVSDFTSVTEDNLEIVHGLFVFYLARGVTLFSMNFEGEEDAFRCPSCGEDVPVGNKLMHSIQCGRHSREGQPESDVVQALSEEPARDSEAPAGSSGASNGNAAGSSSAAASFARLNKPAADPMLVQCEFCEIDVPLDALSKHAFDCGNRTDVCEVCSSYVRLCNFPQHRESGCGVGATSTASPRAARTESAPLIQPDGETGPYHYPRIRQQEAELPTWAPAAIAVVGVGAALAFAMLKRR